MASGTSEELRQDRVNYLRDFIYGGIDGAVTTFAIVAGVVGAELSASVIVILGLANVFADGFSMAASNYSGTKAERDDFKRLQTREREAIRTGREQKLDELRRLYAGRGFSGPDLDHLVATVSAREEIWLGEIMSHIHGIGPVQRSPIRAALATFAAFLVAGFVPLLPFMLGLAASAEVATAGTALVFLVIGAAKSFWSMQRWWASAVETLVIGMAAAGIAYFVGLLLRQFVPAGI